MRRIFIGDIQGCLAALDRLLSALALRPDDRVVCLGDLVNRGPDSLGVLRRVRDLGARTVLGNHDLTLLRMAAGSADREPALESVLKAPDAAQLVDWLGRQPIMVVDDDMVAVHAGLHPGWTDAEAVASAVNRGVSVHVSGRTDADITFATEVRHCTAEGRRPARDDPPPGPPFMPWDHWYAGARTVAFGHWSRRGLVTRNRLRGLDTGCVYGGVLTAWVAEEDRLVHVSG